MCSCIYTYCLRSSFTSCLWLSFASYLSPSWAPSLWICVSQSPRSFTCLKITCKLCKKKKEKKMQFSGRNKLISGDLGFCIWSKPRPHGSVSQEGLKNCCFVCWWTPNFQPSVSSCIDQFQVISTTWKTLVITTKQKLKLDLFLEFQAQIPIFNSVHCGYNYKMWQKRDSPIISPFRQTCCYYFTRYTSVI